MDLDHLQPARRRLQLAGRHFFLLLVLVVILFVLYWETRNLSLTGVAAVLFVAAHVLAALVVMVGGRTLVARFFRKIHGGSAATAPETEGLTIRWAWFYDLFLRLLFAGHVPRIMRSAVRLADLQPDEVALDVGCGTGTLAIMVAQETGRSTALFGIDPAPEMIARARQKADKANVDVTFQTGVAEALAFPDGRFDLVMNSLMMHHLPAALQSRALAEMYRVLRPGGRLLIVDFEPPKAGLQKRILTWLLGEMTAIDNSKLLPRVAAAGFSDIRSGQTDSTLAIYLTAIKPVSS